MLRQISILLVTITLLFVSIGQGQEPIPWDKAQEHYGETVTIEGKIVAAYNSGKACFLNFHEDYKNHFTAVIFSSDLGKFPDNPEDYYYYKTVQVTGLVKKYKGKPEIILKDPSQIVVIETQHKQESPKVVSWKDAHKYYGQRVIVEGTVVATHNSGKACFLNFHQNWKKYFTAVIFASDFPKFPKRPEDYYKGKNITVTGTVKEYKGKPEIVLKFQEQIEIVE